MATITTLLVDDGTEAIVTVQANEAAALAALRDNYGPDEGVADEDLIQHLVDTQGLVIYIGEHHLHLEVLHLRDPDGPCAVQAFLAGERAQLDDYEDVDPGRGYQRSEWNARISDNTKYINRTAAFRAAVGDALEANADSNYIEED